MHIRGRVTLACGRWEASVLEAKDLIGWTAPADVASAVSDVRILASEGLLALTFSCAESEQRRRLSGGCIAVAWPVVFHRVTRTHELRRGHRTCAVAVQAMADGCLDRFYDDLEAVVDDVFAHATQPIHNLEGWITRRLQAATVDGHRRRRGARGALQRPRLPGWLDTGLAHDPWLGHLAIEILIWVGVSATAGTSVWPSESWAERRAAITGDWTGSDAATVEREVERVLAVMRTRPAWYADYVERPLGNKSAQLAPALVDRGGPAPQPEPLAIVEPHEVEDSRLMALATAALEAIERRLSTREDLDQIVAEVVAEVFGEVDTAAELADLPHGAVSSDETVTALLTDRAELARIARVVRDIFAGQ
jgi:hypothetical protein